LLGDGSINRGATARKRVANTSATMKELLETVFYERFVPKVYKENSVR
jgi:hypothetical protein